MRQYEVVAVGPQQWEVRVEDRVLSAHRTQAEAIAEAKRHARTAGGGDVSIQAVDGRIRERDTVTPTEPDVHYHPSVDRSRPSAIQLEAFSRSLSDIVSAAQVTEATMTAIREASENAKTFAMLATRLRPQLKGLSRASDLGKLTRASEASSEFLRAAQTASAFTEAWKDAAREQQTLASSRAAQKAFAENLARISRSLLDVGGIQESIRSLESLSRETRGANHAIARWAAAASTSGLQSDLQKLQASYRSPTELADALQGFRRAALASAELRNALIHAAEVDYATQEGLPDTTSYPKSHDADAD